MNGDHRPDLVTANTDSDTVSVLLNRGDGSFQAKLDYATGRGPGSVAIGDLNGDGKSDLAIANYDAGTVSVLLNKGDGDFQAKLDYATGRSPASVAIGDLNGDRKPDLAAATDETVSVLANRGDGSFGDRQEGPRDLGEAQARHGDAEAQQGQPRRQPRKEAFVRKLFALASAAVLAGLICRSRSSAAVPQRGSRRAAA